MYSQIDNVCHHCPSCKTLIKKSRIFISLKFRPNGSMSQMEMFTMKCSSAHTDCVHQGALDSERKKKNQFDLQMKSVNGYGICK